MDEAGGFPWVLIHLGWVALLGLLIYGVVRSGRLSRPQKQAQQRAAHDNFRVDEDSA